MKFNFLKFFRVYVPVTLLGLLFQSCIIERFGGSFQGEPEELDQNISSGAQQLLHKAFQDVPPGSLVDYHVHVLGLGTGENGIFVNPSMQSWMHPIKRTKFSVFSNAAGITNLNKADQQYITRLVRLIRNSKNQGKFHILAFDKFYHADGSADLEKTEFYIPNEYVVSLAEKYPDIFSPTLSVHPYRSDALEELEKWAQQGIRHLKWLPNAMGINPADERINSFYQTMKKYNMVLLTHTGEEQAVEAERYQLLGNPLLLRKPLEHGIQVIMAHCASLGECVDLDSDKNEKVPCFELFLRMMEDKKYAGLLFGEISALTQINRQPEHLSEIIRRSEFHHRLVNGSDYPLPAVNVIISTKKLMKNGFITQEERNYLNEIYNYNPLLFDFVLKRTIKLPGTEKRLPVEVFTKLERSK